MNVTSEEAQAGLDVIRQTQNRFKKAIASGCSSHLCILWGLICILGFTGLQISSYWGGLFYTGLDIVGIILTIAIIRRGPTRSVSEGDTSQNIHRIWPALLIYAFIWAWILRPSGPMQACAYVVTVCGFAFVLIGIWSRVSFMIWLGSVVTLFILVGYYGLPSYFYAWTAVFAGGTVLGTGLYIRRWR
ncbi:MAG: hypothetical protein ACYSSN_05495 [Planctomycetota bacterium]|jgi:hypothetical protein